MDTAPPVPPDEGSLPAFCPDDVVKRIERSSASPLQMKVAVQLIIRLLTNVLRDPSESKFRRVKLSNKTIREKLLQNGRSEDSVFLAILKECGFADQVVIDHSEELVCPESMDPNEMEWRKDLLTSIVENLGTDPLVAFEETTGGQSNATTPATSPSTEAASSPPSLLDMPLSSMSSSSLPPSAPVAKVCDAPPLRRRDRPQDMYEKNQVTIRELREAQMKKYEATKGRPPPTGQASSAQYGTSQQSTQSSSSGGGFFSNLFGGGSSSGGNGNRGSSDRRNNVRTLNDYPKPKRGG